MRRLSPCLTEPPFWSWPWGQTGLQIRTDVSISDQSPPLPHEKKAEGTLHASREENPAMSLCQ